MKKIAQTKGQEKFFLSMVEIEQEFLPESYKKKLQQEEMGEQYLPGTGSLSDILCAMNDQIRK